MSIRTFHEQAKNAQNDPLLRALHALKQIENPNQTVKAAGTSVAANWQIWT